MSIDLTNLRDQAVTSVTDTLYAHHPELEQRFGERGRHACRQDILYHLDYLQSALDACAPEAFVNYALWLQSILSTRGVPSGHLAESFDLLADFLRQHLAPDQSALASAPISAARDALASNCPTMPYSQARLPALPDAEPYRDAILRGEHRTALNLVTDVIQAGNSYSEAAVCLIQPALYDVGRLWQENRISVAQEHLATAVSQNVLARAYQYATFAPATGRHAMFACVAGNHHTLGLRMLSDTFETAGWEVGFLGADVPITDLVREVDARHPHLLALSLSLPSHLTIARETIARLRSELGNACPEIWAGGLITLAGERLWRSIGADGWAADALDALEQIRP